MSSTFKEACKVFGLQLMFAFVAVMFIASFTWLTDTNTGAKIYSGVTALIFLSTVYSFVWQAGRRDVRYLISHNKHLLPGEQPGTIKWWKGLAIGLIGSVPGFAALGVYVYAWLQGTDTQFYAIVNMCFRVYQFAFMGFLGNDNLTYIWNCVIVTFIVPLICPIAYFAGTKQFALLERVLPGVIYKKREPKKRRAR